MDYDRSKVTPRPWGWWAEDASMVTLSGAEDELRNHVLSCSPCSACQKKITEMDKWKWGRCVTPNRDDAHHIAHCVNHHDELVAMLEYCKERLLDAAEAADMKRFEDVAKRVDALLQEVKS